MSFATNFPTVNRASLAKRFCAESINQAEMLAFLFGASLESEKPVKRVSHDSFTDTPLHFNVMKLFL